MVGFDLPDGEKHMIWRGLFKIGIRMEQRMTERNLKQKDEEKKID